MLGILNGLTVGTHLEIHNCSPTLSAVFAYSNETEYYEGMFA